MVNPATVSVPKPAIMTAGAFALALSGCVISSLFIDIDAYYEDGELWFKDPNQSWFMKHCVRAVSVTRYDNKTKTNDILWEAQSADSGCLTTIPLSYGKVERPPDPDDYIAPQPLEPGAQYEIFVELDNGAGSGSFTIEDDGSINNEG